MKNSMESKLKAFEKLLQIMDELREKCPWDKKQTFESLRYLTIEEVFELSDAILENDKTEIKKEIGDVLLHLVFYSKIASETADFDIADVIESLCEKLIYRHPHIYGNVEANDEEQVKKNWEQLKLKEGINKTVLAGVPKSLPALVKAIRIQEKARSVGFDWENKSQVWDKVQEELEELKVEESAHIPDVEKISDEFGDVLFSLINYARFIGVNAEDALERTNKKFIKRFNFIEHEAKKKGKSLDDMSLQEMDELWLEAKRN
jgi:XTP/dITP diphosphohydrolase